MAEEAEPHYAESDDAGKGPDRTTGTPRWVKVFGLVILLVVLLFIIVRVTGVGGQHGPSRHGLSGDDTPAGDTRGADTASGVTAGSHA